MTNIEWLPDHRIKVDPPKRPKKITGTRFATILGLNPWSTPFEIWCALTRTYEKPFEDTIYTIAGKTIEPKQADYMEKMYGMDIVRPKDIWGEDYFHKTYGDFYHEVPIFGGMWDYLEVEDGDVVAILEMKTTKRAEDWKTDIPEYYALQVALYVYLWNKTHPKKPIDMAIMVPSFLEESDYDHPDKYVPSVENTSPVPFKVSERYPDFDEKIATVEKWWKDYVLTGISPQYDEKKDAEILKALRTHSVDTSTGSIENYVKEAEQLKSEIDTVTASVADKQKRLKELNDIIKGYATKQFRDGDKKVEIKGSTYCFTVSKSTTETIDKTALKKDGLYDKYSKKSESYRLTVKSL